MSTPLSSSPASPAVIAREIGPLRFELSADGLSVAGPVGGEVRFDVEQALALSDFLRGPGARVLITRSWLAGQHAAALAAQGDEVNRRL